MNAIGSMSQPLDVLIVGAGISGIGLAAHLRQECPARRFAIVEQRASLGGTWDLFRYPGIRSDSDMHTLGYAFEPWREPLAIAGGDAIRGYLEEVADKYRLQEHMTFDQRVVAADWSASAGIWRVTVETAAGDRRDLSARFLFLGSGYYDYDAAHDAALPGIERFAGPVLHPQFWPSDFDYSGKRVVVIGSGATAVTLVPAMAQSAAMVTMVQRTPSWYLSIPSRDRLADTLRRFLPWKLTAALIRARNILVQEYLFRRSREKPAQMREFLRRQLVEQLGENFDETAFSPPYNPWEQRMCFVPDGDLFTALKSGKAQVVTGTIAAVDENGISLSDGRRIDADILVTATGLKLAVLGKIAVSLDGVPLKPAEHVWYRNCMLSNVPNFAALFGYLNAGWTLRVDIVSEWLCRLFNQMDAWQVDVATPVLPKEHGLEEIQPFDMFTSGYLQRGKHLIPKSTTTAPWRIHMQYRKDKKELGQAAIDDGVMQFTRLRATAEVS